MSLFSWRPRVVTFLGALYLGLTLPATAFAHGKLKGSSPADGAHLAAVPSTLRLDFSEAPELTFSSIRLIAGDGREVPLGAMTYAPDSHRSLVAPLAAALVAGTYTIVWQMAGDDGHPVRGRIQFVIAPGAAGIGVTPSNVAPVGGTAPGDTAGMAMHHDPVSMPTGAGFDAESPVYVLVRWLQFIGLLLAIGAVAFHTFVLAFIRRDERSEAQAVEAPLLAEVEGRAASIGHGAAMALAVMLLVRLAAQSYAMHGPGTADSALVGSMITGTMWGWGWLLQLAGVVLVGVGFHNARHTTSFAVNGRPGSAGGNQTHLWWRLAGVGVLLLAFSPGLSSHASAAPRMRWLAMLADGIHVLAASSWLGTLAVVLLAGLAVSAAHSAEVRAPFVRDLINAFSPLALVSSGIAAGTGTFAAWLHVGTVPNLWSTRYGITLLVKLGILGVVALTGFYNWRFVKPRLGTDDATLHLRRSARVEITVAVIVLLVTAVLVATPTSMDMAM